MASPAPSAVVIGSGCLALDVDHVASLTLPLHKNVDVCFDLVFNHALGSQHQIHTACFLCNPQPPIPPFPLPPPPPSVLFPPLWLTWSGPSWRIITNDMLGNYTHPSSAAHFWVLSVLERAKMSPHRQTIYNAKHTHTHTSTLYTHTHTRARARIHTHALCSEGKSGQLHDLTCSAEMKEG